MYRARSGGVKLCRPVLTGRENGNEIGKKEGGVTQFWLYPIDAEWFARNFGCSRAHICRVFVAFFVTPFAYLGDGAGLEGWSSLLCAFRE